MTSPPLCPILSVLVPCTALICPVGHCPRVFARPSELRKHQQQEHSIGNRKVSLQHSEKNIRYFQFWYFLILWAMYGRWCWGAFFSTSTYSGWSHSVHICRFFRSSTYCGRPSADFGRAFSSPSPVLGWAWVSRLFKVGGWVFSL